MNNSDFDMNTNMNMNLNNNYNNDSNNYAGNMQSFEEQQEINGYGNNYGEVVYDESSSNGIKDFINNNKKIVILVLIIAILVIVLLMLRGCSASGKVNSIVVKSNDIIYVGEESNIEVEASGSNTGKTKYDFKLSNDTLASLKEKEMSGSKVTNTITAQNSGTLNVEVNASLGKTNVKNSKNILICKKLNDSSVIIEKLTLKKGRKFYLKDNLSLGVSGCSDNLTYTSSDTSIASISGDGIVTANKKGNSTITISNGTNQVTYIVEVKDIVNGVTGISVNKNSVSLKVGSKVTITPSIKPSNATIKGVIWKSNNEAIATVDNGVITGIKPGKATVTVTTVDGGHRAIINVNVISKTNSNNNTGGNNSGGISTGGNTSGGNNSGGTSTGGNTSGGNTGNTVVKPTKDNLVIKLEKSNLNYTKELYIIGTITSNVGISGYQITTNSNTPSKWINANNVKSVTIPETDAFKITKNGTYYVWAKNKNGEVKKSSININNITDKVADIALTLSTNNYTNSDVTIMGTITDNTSGLSAYAITNSNSQPSDWTIVNGTKTLELPNSASFKKSSNGTYYVWAKNQAGNVTNKAITIKNIDKTKPTCSLTVNDSGVLFSAKNDSESGIASYGLSTSNTADYSNKNSIGLSASTFYGFVKDKAGNTSSCTFEVKSATEKCPSGYSSDSSGKCVKVTDASVSYTYSSKCPKDYTAYSGGQYDCLQNLGYATETKYYTRKAWQCKKQTTYKTKSYSCVGFSKSKCRNKSGCTYKQGECRGYYNFTHTYNNYYWGPQVTTSSLTSCSQNIFECTGSTVGKTYITCTYSYSSWSCPSGSYHWSGDHKCYKYANKVSSSTPHYSCSSSSGSLSGTKCYSYNNNYSYECASGYKKVGGKYCYK